MGKTRKPLHLRGLQVFEAIARHSSVTDAASELGITQSAASHQLRLLSQRLGEELTARRGRRTELTAAGKNLALSLELAFDIIEQRVGYNSTDRIVVRIGVYSSFAIKWLTPRLSRFYLLHPHIDLRVVMLNDPHEISVRTADLFVTSEAQRPGYASTQLFTELLIPVVGGAFAPTFKEPLPLISAEIEPGIAGRAWHAFASLNGFAIEMIKKGDWYCCSHYILALEMALAGIGAALLPDFVVAGHIADGSLRTLPGRPLPTGQHYEMHVQFERRSEPALSAVAGWLSAEAARSFAIS